MQRDFFRKLMNLFRICEDLENSDGLHMIFKIIRGIGQYFFLLFVTMDSCGAGTDKIYFVFFLLFSFTQQSANLRENIPRRSYYGYYRFS